MQYRWDMGQKELVQKAPLHTDRQGKGDDFDISGVMVKHKNALIPSETQEWGRLSR